MKKITAFLSIAFTLFSSATAFAEEFSAPAKSIDRIKWSVLCCGKPTNALYVAVALLVILIAISVFYYKKISGGNKK